MIRKLFAFAACAALAGSAADASTIKTFYYVGNPYEVDNSLGDDRPLMTTGTLEIDTADLPCTTLACRTIGAAVDLESPEFYDVVAAPGYRSLTINGVRSDLDRHIFRSEFQFDASGMPGRWSMRHEPFDSICFTPCYAAEGNVWTGEGFDGYAGNFYQETFLSVPEERDRFLRERGYDPSMSAYQQYFEDDAIWVNYRFADGPGQWFDTLAEFEAAVAHNTELALANPARSFNDIAPIPLPAAGWLLLAGMAGLAAYGRRRA